MKKLATVRVASVLWVVMLFPFLCVPVYASTADPDSFSIDSVFAYQHCLEEDDQLYLVEYSITYGENPDENATEAYLLRLMNGAVELGSIAPYSYYDDGYGTGVIAIYFSAAEAPAWEGAYTMRLEGNPTIDWTDGTPPLTSVETFDSWSSSPGITTTQNELASRILYLADQLELDWAINMIDTEGSASYLSDYGEAYFTNVIENLQAMAPVAFAGSSEAMDFPAVESDPSWSYAETREGSVDDTPLDTQDLADHFGVSRIWVSSILWLAGAGMLLYFGLAPTGSFRPLILLSGPIVYTGGYLGGLDMVFCVLMGVAAFGLSLFFLFYHPAAT